jgi:hypothetical protein
MGRTDFYDYPRANLMLQLLALRRGSFVLCMRN